MALRITEPCVNCFACLDVCPTGAVTRRGARFRIDAGLCTECDGSHADPQCASICPVEGAIVDAAGVAINPPGSLTGIPPSRLAAVAVAETKRAQSVPGGAT